MRLKSPRLCTALTAFSLCSASAAIASSPSSGQTAELRSMAVAVNDLNVATAAGYAEALARISAVARHLCNLLHNTPPLDERDSAAESAPTAIPDTSTHLLQLTGHPP